MHEFRDNLRRLENLQTELKMLRDGSSVQAQSYEQMTGSGTSDKVYTRVERLDWLEHEIVRLEARVRPLVVLIGDLEEGAARIRDGEFADLLDFFRLRYLSAGTMRQVAREMHISPSRAYRLKDRLAKLAAGYLGM